MPPLDTHSNQDLHIHVHIHVYYILHSLLFATFLYLKMVLYARHCSYMYIPVGNTTLAHTPTHTQTHTHSNTHTSVSTSERMFQDARYHTVKRFLFLFLVLCAFDADDDSTWEFCKFSAEGRVGDKSSGAIDRRPVLVFVLFPTRYAIAPLAG